MSPYYPEKGMAGEAALAQSKLGEAHAGARASASSSLALVLVVPADPDLPGLALVAALGCVVEDRVVAHQKLQSTPRRRVRVVDAVLISYEATEPRALSQVTNDVGPRCAGVVLDD